MTSEVLVMIEIGIGVTTALLTGLILWIVSETRKRSESHEKKHDGIDRFIMASLRYNMVCIHDKAMKEGRIEPHQKLLFYEHYDEYKGRGGNHYIEDLKVDIDNL